MTRSRLLGSSLVGALDQALLSAFSLAVGLAFIRYASKSEYASYALAGTALLLVQSLQNALVNSPLATLAPAADPARRLAVDAAGRNLQRRLVVGAVGLGATLAATAWLVGHRSWAELLAACTLAAVGLMVREYRRAQCFLRHEAWAALQGDGVYAALALSGLAGLLYVDRLSASAALAVIGVAGIVGGRSVPPDRTPPPKDAASDAARAIWSCAKWALPSVFNSWLYANAYLFLVERLMSKEAVADLSASRLMLVPLSLLVVGWSSAFRPRASQWLAAGEAAQVHRVALGSAWAFVGAGLAYGGLLLLAMPLLQAGLLGDKYLGASTLVLPWLLFVTTTAVRSVGMSSMLASPAAFRPLFRYGVLALVVAVPCTLAAALTGAVSRVPLALAVAEAFLLVLVWCRGWPQVRAASELRR